MHCLWNNNTNSTLVELCCGVHEYHNPRFEHDPGWLLEVDMCVDKDQQKNALS